MTNKCVTCKKCGWVHFAVSEQYVKDWEEEWKVFWPSLDAEGRESYGLPDGPPSREFYLKCQCGNSYKNFRDSLPNDCPSGATIGPILDRNE